MSEHLLLRVRRHPYQWWEALQRCPCYQRVACCASVSGDATMPMISTLGRADVQDATFVTQCGTHLAVLELRWFYVIVENKLLQMFIDLVVEDIPSKCRVGLQHVGTATIEDRGAPQELLRFDDRVAFVTTNLRQMDEVEDMPSKCRISLQHVMSESEFTCSTATSQDPPQAKLRFDDRVAFIDPPIGS